MLSESSEYMKSGFTSWFKEGFVDFFGIIKFELLTNINININIDIKCIDIYRRKIKINFMQENTIELYF
jgi:hypothetical protein